MKKSGQLVRGSEAARICGSRHSSRTHTANRPTSGSSVSTYTTYTYKYSGYRYIPKVPT